MFGLTLEKLFLVALVAGIVIGPRRLPHYAQKLAELMRTVRGALDHARNEASIELGVSREEWESLDPRRYDPRRIMREAMSDAGTTTAVAPVPDGEPAPTPELLAQAARVRPGQTYVVTGSAAHPRRIRIDSLPEHDPRRSAAAPFVEEGAAPTTP